jgi:hypothetical protein
MVNENIKVELQKITDELDLLYQLTVEDYLNEKSRYYIGVLAGIDYARMELQKLVEDLINKGWS